VIRRIVLAAQMLILAPSAANAAMICVLSPTGVAFGQFSGSKLTSTGAIVVHCIGNGRADYELELSTGESGTYDPREMKKGPNRLSYNLYTDASHAEIWGDGRHGTEVVSGRLDIDRQGFLTFSIPVYGKIPKQPEPAPGNYSDTIVATFDYDRKEATTSFADTANVMPGCAISAGDLQFFTYTGAQRDARSEITVSCTNSTRWNVGLNPGTYPGATVTTRRMTGPKKNSSLSYSLFRNSGRTQNWGETIGSDTESGTGTGNPQTLDVYGRVPASQSPAAGGYEDTITATITF
jgi:spore coat protein U domain-containing protein, fimbrial subunit CupE1/2/3/6